MAEQRNITQLLKASDYRTMRNTLRGVGVGSIIFGVIGIGIGSSAINVNPINAILVMIGIGLVLEGIWVVCAPSPIGLIVEGIVKLSVAIRNIFVTLNNTAAARCSIISQQTQ